MHVAIPINLLPAAMLSTTNKPSPTDVAATAKRRWGKRNFFTLQVEQQLPDASSAAYSDICTYWTANPAFDLTEATLFHQFEQDQNCVCRFIPSSCLSPSVGIRCQSPSFSRTKRSTRLRNVYLPLPIPCAERVRNQSSSVKVISFGCVHRRIASR